MQEYKIEPKNGILLIQKHKNTSLHQDIAIEETDNDKSLISATVLKGNVDYEPGDGIIIGKYSIFHLTLKGTDYYFCHKDDVIAKTSYVEA
jgi:co-chaperonin GroES (HSP10)